MLYVGVLYVTSAVPREYIFQVEKTVHLYNVTIHDSKSLFGPVHPWIFLQCYPVGALHFEHVLQCNMSLYPGNNKGQMHAM